MTKAVPGELLLYDSVLFLMAYDLLFLKTNKQTGRTLGEVF